MSSKIYLYALIILFISHVNAIKEGEEKSDDIIILHTNDVHCAIMETIGYDGLNLYKKELEKKYKHVLLVDAGDHIQGGAIGVISRGADLVNITNYLAYDVIALGNHEFDYTIEQLMNLSLMNEAGYTCSNFLYRKNHTVVFDKYKIVNVSNNISIGFIGVLTPQTLTKSYLHTLVDDDGELTYDLLTNDEGQELYDYVQEVADELKYEKNVTYVIIVAHMGYGGDALEQYTTPALLEHINGVDAIIDGHSHQVYNSTFPDKDGKEVYISQTGTKLKNVGKLTIKSDGNITSEIISEIPLFNDYDGDYLQVNRSGTFRYVDNETNTFLNQIMESHSKEFKEVIGYVDFDLDIVNDERGHISRFEENTLCNLVADAFKHFGKTDIAIVNAGTIRTSLKKGNITYNSILDILPFSANLMVFQISGKDILDALEFSTSISPLPASKFLQVSNMKFKVDESIASTVVIDEFENFVRVDGARRVFDVYIGNKKLEETKQYSLAIDNFLADGGDGYTIFSKYENKNDTMLIDNDVLKRYIMDILDGTVPDMYKTTQGRIIKEKKKVDPEPGSDSNFVKYFRVLPLLLLCLIF